MFLLFGFNKGTQRQKSKRVSPRNLEGHFPVLPPGLGKRYQRRQQLGLGSLPEVRKEIDPLKEP